MLACARERSGLTSVTMSTPRDSLPEPLRAQIEAAALSFAAQIVGAFEKSIGDVTARLAAQASTAPVRTARPAAKRASKEAAKVAPTQGRAFERRIESALKTSDGMGAEQLNRALGSTTPDLAPVLQRLMDQGRVGKRGKARGTKYYLV